MPTDSKSLIGRFFGRTSDPLLRNSFFLLMGAWANAGLGFVFWLLAANLYLPEDIGLATSIISSIALIILISRFGLDNSIIRFYPTRDKASLFGTSIVITTASSVILAVIFILGIGFFAPSLSSITSPLVFLLFLIFTVLHSIFWQASTAFLAARKANYYFYGFLINDSKIILLLPLITLGAIGIFSAFGLALVLSTIASIFFLAKVGIKVKLTVDKKFLRDSFVFSSSNYINQLLIWAPTLLLPIISLNSLGAADAAFYYIAYAIAAALYMIPTAISTSLFVEGSHGRELRLMISKSVKTTMLVLVPFAILLFLFGNIILGVIGPEYSSNGFDLLRVMLLAAFFVAIVQIGMSVMKVRNANSHLIIISAWVFASLIISSLILVGTMGLIGLGYSWLISYGSGSALLLVLLMRERGNRDGNDAVQSKS